MSNNTIGVVAIGRNEGERLRRCLTSVEESVALVVYVDSGSADGSVMMARDMGVEVVELDMSIPFTAARARNEGMARLLELNPLLTYVQFVDGDCEIAQDWLGSAEKCLSERGDIAVVCGRRRERFPERSVYNLLCDLEWDTPVGEAKACGGDALMRVAAFNAVGGYRDELIAGEEPELCVRLRACGWTVWRIDEEMTMHDAAMTRFGQWWRRTMRGGHAFAEGVQLHGAPPERHWVAESRRAWLWGLWIPSGVAVAMMAWGWGWAILLVVYPLQVVRLALKGKRSTRENFLLAFYLTLGKFPETIGQLKFLMRKIGAGRTALIEYK